MFKRPLHILLLGSLFTLICFWAGVILYANQSKLPQGLTITDWRVDSLDIKQFKEVFPQRISQLYEKEVILLSAHPQVPTLTLSLQDLGLTIDQKQVDEAVQALSEGNFWTRAQRRWMLSEKTLELPMTMDMKQLKYTMDTTIHKIEALQPVDAERVVTEADQVQYIAGKEGYRVDVQALEQQLLQQISHKLALSATEPDLMLQLQLPLVKVKPKATVESLKAEGVERKIIQFSTNYNRSSEGRSHNIEATAKVVHDTLLAPDEVFDYEKIIEKTREAHGFKKAPVILNGKLVPGIGGGICQVSTTLYNAVLRAGLDIVERRNHSLPVSYIPMGLDATYSTGYINFKFKNTSGSYLLIRTSMENRRLTVKLFGTMPKSVKYELETKVVSTIEPPIKYLYNPNLAKGSEQVLKRGKTGYKVETYRIKKENGREVKRERISLDTYQATPTLVARNQGGPSKISPKQPNRIIEDGVDAPIYED